MTCILSPLLRIQQNGWSVLLVSLFQYLMVYLNRMGNTDLFFKHSENEVISMKSLILLNWICQLTHYVFVLEFLLSVHGYKC